MSAEKDTAPPIAYLRQMASTIASRFGLATKAGVTFAGARDVYAALGYQKCLGAEDYRQRYDRNGVACRIVEAFPNSTWRSGAEIVDDEDPNANTAFEEAWIRLEDRLQLWPAFGRADILAGLGEYAALLIGVNDGAQLDQPLAATFAADKVIYTAAFSQEDVEIKSTVSEASNPRFGQPEVYTFGRIGVPRGTSGRPLAATEVHWSRVIHIADGLLDDKIHGKPRLRDVWNYLDDLDKIAGGGAEAFWLRAHQGYVANLDPDLEWNATDIKDVKDQIEEFANQIRRTIGQRGVDFSALGSDVAEIGGNVDAIFRLISAAKGIPVRILTGSERGELASSQDKTNFDDRVSDRRTAYAEPMIVRPFIDRLIEHGALPKPTDDSYMVRWPQLDALDDQQRAAVAVMYATINKQAGTTVISIDEIRERVLNLPALSELDLLPGELDSSDAATAPGAGDEAEPRGARVVAMRKKKGPTIA